MEPSRRSYEEAEALGRRLGRRFRMLNWLWVLLSLLQLASCLGAIAAAWNLHVLWSRRKVPRLLEQRSPAVLQMYQNDTGWFLSFLLINVALGGLVGAGLIVYELLLIRGPVLEHRDVFGG